MSLRTAIASGLELGLALVGLVVLWKLALSPAARARRRETPAPLAAWDAPFSDFLLFLCLIVCGAVAGQFLAAALFKPLALSEDGKLVFRNAGFELGMIGGIVLYHFGLHGGGQQGPTARVSAVASGFATFLVAMPLVLLSGFVWQNLLLVMGLPVEPQEIMTSLINAESSALLVGMIGLATIGAPIAEELIFRAGFFRYARTRMPRWAALLLSACFFAALHGSLAMFAQLVVLGIVFALAYERTGRISTAIIAHALFNTHSVVVVLIDPSMGG